jgi:hypothetical protein
MSLRDIYKCGCCIECDTNVGLSSWQIVKSSILCVGRPLSSSSLNHPTIHLSTSLGSPHSLDHSIFFVLSSPSLPINMQRLEDTKVVQIINPAKAEAQYKAILSKQPGSNDGELKEYELALLALGKLYRDGGYDVS